MTTKTYTTFILAATCVLAVGACAHSSLPSTTGAPSDTSSSGPAASQDPATAPMSGIIFAAADDGIDTTVTTVRAIDPQSGTITATRLIRNGEACSDLPSHEVTNTITLENGVPIRTAPVRASAGPCLDPASDGRATTEIATRPFKLAPDAGAPELPLDRVAWVALGGGRDQTTNGFHQVLFRADGDSLTWYCAYTDEVGVAKG